jgi:hypothetical protein
VVDVDPEEKHAPIQAKIGPTANLLIDRDQGRSAIGT